MLQVGGGYYSREKQRMALNGLLRKTDERICLNGLLRETEKRMETEGGWWEGLQREACNQAAILFCG